MKKLIESANVRQANAVAACAAAPFHAASFFLSAYLAPLFWSVFGPAARYNFGNPEFAYDASLKQ